MVQAELVLSVEQFFQLSLVLTMLAEELIQKHGHLPILAEELSVHQE